MKRIISLVCVLCCALGLLAFPAGAAGGVQTFTCTPEFSHFIQEPDPNGEIRIGPAVLETADGAREVWLVTVRGIDWSGRGANSFSCYISMLFNNDCGYYNRTKDAINQYVPAGAAVVLYGHSLGGMVVQRLICDKSLTDKYEFMNAVTFGSPYVVTDKSLREGRLVRLEDTDDIVPRMSLAMFTAPSDYNGATKRSGGYGARKSGAHNLSYQNAGVWGAFDALGTENGGAVLRLDLGRLVTLDV